MIVGNCSLSFPVLWISPVGLSMKGAMAGGALGGIVSQYIGRSTVIHLALFVWLLHPFLDLPSSFGVLAARPPVSNSMWTASQRTFLIMRRRLAKGILIECVALFLIAWGVRHAVAFREA